MSKGEDTGSKGEKLLSPRDRVIKDVVRGLYDGEFEPGQRLVEAQLTEKYGISRGPVREALNRLAAMGVVEMVPQRGAQIRILSLRDAIDSLVVAQGLVCMAARLAAERDDADKQPLRDAVEDLSRFEQTSSSLEYATARDAFYSTLNRLAGNSVLSRVMMQVQMDLVQAQFRSILRTVDRRRHRDYHDITEAVLCGDGAKAERTAKSHLGRSIAALKAFEAKSLAA